VERVVIVGVARPGEAAFVRSSVVAEPTSMIVATAAVTKKAAVLREIPLSLDANPLKGVGSDAPRASSIV